MSWVPDPAMGPKGGKAWDQLGAGSGTAQVPDPAELEREPFWDEPGAGSSNGSQGWESLG